MTTIFGKNRKNHFTGLSIWMASGALLLSNCSQESSLDSLNGSARREKGKLNTDNVEEELFDFSLECGLSKEKLENKDAVLVDGNFTSFPIVIQGTSMGTQFAVITQAKLQISATGKQTTQNVQVSVKDTGVDAPGIAGLIAPAIVKSKAKKAAAKSSGTTITKSLPKGEWLKLTNGSNPEYKDILCAANGTKHASIAKDGGTAEVTYSPALISSVNPLAPIERMRKEFGDGKKFTITANVSNSAGHLIAGTYQGTVTVKEVDAAFTYMKATVNADIAYQFDNNFPGGAYKLGLPKRQIIYIDTKNKVIRAIYREDDRIDETTGKVTPPAVLVRD